MNTYGRLVVRATKVGADTALAQIARLVDEAQSGKAPVQRLADRVSAIFVPIVIVLALLTLGGWLLAGRISRQRLHGRRLGADHRLPLRVGPRHPDRTDGRDRARCADGRTHQGPEILEQTRRVDTIVLDKTGTVTEGQDGARRGFAGEWSDARRGPAPRWRRGQRPSIRSPRRRVGRAGGDRRRRRSRRSATSPAPACLGSSKATK